LTLTDRFQQFGYRLPRLRRSVWLTGTAPQIAAAYPVVDQALRQRPGYGLVLISSPDALHDLRQLYPHEIVLPAPRPRALKRWREALDPALRLDAANILKAGDIASELPELAAGASSSDVIPPLVTRLAGSPIADITELGRRLGAPRTILCLGNGPSSEDPRLREMPHDALFRVNWIWRARGLLTEPDMVFTADPDLPTGKKRPIVIFPTREAGLPILSGYCRRLSPPRRGYGFFDELLPGQLDPSEDRLPTNGALMIALAATLAPQQLIIAGMDLYAHRDGRYPGDDKAVDGYARQHDRQSDLFLIRKALARYSGETIIIGEQLRAALDQG
jgi:hypothetical protein